MVVLGQFVPVFARQLGEIRLFFRSNLSPHTHTAKDLQFLPILAFLSLCACSLYRKSPAWISGARYVGVRVLPEDPGQGPPDNERQEYL